MLELGGRTGFALEALDEFLIEGERERQYLDRDFAVELLFLRLENDRHAAAAQLVEDFVLLGELVANHVYFGDVRRVDARACGRRRGQIETARVTELGSVLILGAAARAVHPVSEGAGPNLGFALRPVNNLEALRARDTRAGRGIGDDDAEPIAALRHVAQLDAALLARDGARRGRIELEQHRRAAAAEQSTDRAEYRTPPFAFQPHDGVIRRAAREPVDLVVQMHGTAFRASLQRID